MVQLFVQKINELVEVELAEGIPITFIKTFKSYENIANTQIPKTLPIDIPASKSNKNIFDDFLQVNKVSAQLSYKSTIKAELYLNSNPLIVGYLQVLRYDKDSGLIKAVIYNEELQVFEILKNEYMSQLDFSDLNYTANETNTINSWTNGLNSGKTIIPLADNGQGFGYQNPDNLGFVIDITAGDSINPKLLSPAFKVSELFTRLFRDISDRMGLPGFNININTTNLFWYYNLKPSEAQNSPVDFVSDGLFYNKNFAISAGGDYPVSLYQDSDPSGMFFNYGIKALHDGDYKIELDLQLTAREGIADELFLEAWKNGTKISTLFGFELDGSKRATTTITLSTGDLLTFRVKNNQANLMQFTSFTGSARVTAIGTAGTSIPGGVVYANNYFDKLKKSDFLRDFIKAFNLVIYLNEDRRLIIEHYDDWLNSGDSIDLTNNILESGYSVVNPYEVLYKSLNFSFFESEDYGNKVYKRTQKELYGSGKFDSNIPNVTNELDNELSFSPFLRVQLQDNKRGAANLTSLFGIKNVASPQDLDASAYNEKYLIYYNGFKTGVTTYKIGSSSTNFAPYFSHYSAAYNAQIKTTDTDLNWLFSSPPTESGYVFASDFDPVNSGTLFNRHYSNYVEMLYSNDSKILEVQAVLKPYNFGLIQNNSKIIIEGVAYIILNMSYSLNTLTAKMKLLKIT